MGLNLYGSWLFQVMRRYAPTPSGSPGSISSTSMTPRHQDGYCSGALLDPVMGAHRLLRCRKEVPELPEVPRFRPVVPGAATTRCTCVTTTRNGACRCTTTGGCS